MGIRVHKMIGWGLTNLKTKGKKIDPRINPNGIICADQNEMYDEFSQQNYLKWLKKLKYKKNSQEDFNRQIEILGLKDHPKEDVVTKFCTGCEDYGMEKVLCITPMCHPDWDRFDNIIDWIEENDNWKSGSGSCDRVEVLEDGIYPYSGFYMDSRTGESLESDVACYFRRTYNTMRTMAKQKGKIAKSKAREIEPVLDRIASKMAFSKKKDVFPFKNRVQALKHMAPIIPFPVRAICEFGQAFIDPKVILQLRPILYVYWG